jgi:ketosteroid isomerase-like protein
LLFFLGCNKVSADTSVVKNLLAPWAQRGHMKSDEAEIRTLIERWAKAVHSGNIDGVLADHADDIVMFDVPPPANGVRGSAAYRATWPPFVKWQPSPTPCSAAAPLTSSGRTRAIVFASPSDCAKRTGGGSSRTSITHFPPGIEGSTLLLAPRPAARNDSSSLCLVASYRAG